MRPAVYIGASVLAFGAVTMIQAASTNWQTLMGLCVGTLPAHPLTRFRRILLGATEGLVRFNSLCLRSRLPVFPGVPAPHLVVVPSAPAR